MVTARSVESGEGVHGGARVTGKRCAAQERNARTRNDALLRYRARTCACGCVQKRNKLKSAIHVSGWNHVRRLYQSEARRRVAHRMTSSQCTCTHDEDQNDLQIAGGAEPGVQYSGICCMW